MKNKNLKYKTPFLKRREKHRRRRELLLERRLKSRRRIGVKIGSSGADFIELEKTDVKETWRSKRAGNSQGKSPAPMTDPIRRSLRPANHDSGELDNGI